MCGEVALIESILFCTDIHYQIIHSEPKIRFSRRIPLWKHVFRGWGKSLIKLDNDDRLKEFFLSTNTICPMFYYCNWELLSSSCQAESSTQAKMKLKASNGIWPRFVMFSFDSHSQNFVSIDLRTTGWCQSRMGHWRHDRKLVETKLWTTTVSLRSSTHYQTEGA